MKDLIHGGLADHKPDSDFDMKNILKGMKVEREHTTDKRVQKEIAKDHLTEDPQYYQKLEKMEKSAEEDRVTPYHLNKIEKHKQHHQEQLMNHYDKHFDSIGVAQAPKKKKMEKKSEDDTAYRYAVHHHISTFNEDAKKKGKPFRASFKDNNSDHHISIDEPDSHGFFGIGKKKGKHHGLYKIHSNIGKGNPNGPAISFEEVGVEKKAFWKGFNAR